MNLALTALSGGIINTGFVAILGLQQNRRFDLGHAFIVGTVLGVIGFVGGQLAVAGMAIGVAVVVLNDKKNDLQTLFMGAVGGGIIGMAGNLFF